MMRHLQHYIVTKGLQDADPLTKEREKYLSLNTRSPAVQVSWPSPQHQTCRLPKETYGHHQGARDNGSMAASSQCVAAAEWAQRDPHHHAIGGQSHFCWGRGS